MSSYLVDSGITVKIQMSDQTADVTAGNIIGFIGFSIFTLIVITGIFVEYTPLFNKPNVSKESRLEQSKTKLGLFFLSFSFTRNIAKMFAPVKQANDDNLVILNGIRCLSIMWVVVGHGFMMDLITPTVNLSDLTSFIHPMWFAIIPSGVFAVDVFFFISAFLAAYLMLVKYFWKSGLNFVMIYFHRVFRLLPPLALLTALYLTFYMYIGNGPIWFNQSQTAVELCREQWWYNMLFINNVLPSGNPSS